MGKMFQDDGSAWQAFVAANRSPSYGCDWPAGSNHTGGERLGDLSLCAHHKGLAVLRLRSGYANALPEPGPCGTEHDPRMLDPNLPDACVGCGVPGSTRGARYCHECRALARRVGRDL